jgi:hypothetical protein
MKVYVCWDEKPAHPIVGAHPCGVAAKAVKDAGHDPEIVKAYGWAKLPAALNRTTGRREVRELTGRDEVPVLVLDDGTAIAGSREIVAWAKANPAPKPS